MSAEVAKKRGRPKKVVLDSIAAESVAKPTARAKSTKAVATKPPVTKPVASKPAVKTTAKAAAAAKEPAKATQKPAAKPKLPRKTVSAAAASVPPPPPDSLKGVPDSPDESMISKSTISSSTPETSAKAVTKPVATIDASGAKVKTSGGIQQTQDAGPTVKVTPEKSEILKQVRIKQAEPGKKMTEPTPKISSPTRPSTSTPNGAATTSVASPLNQTPVKQPLFAAQSTQQPIVSSAPSKGQATTPIVPKKPLTFDEMARQTLHKPVQTGLPPNYKQTARKVTATIVALPILIVTSWVLYERFVLGKERKLLVPPPSASQKADEPSATPAAS